MKKTYTIFIAVSIGILIFGTTHAQQPFYVDRIDKAPGMVKNHFNLKTLQEFVESNKIEPAVRRSKARILPKADAEVIHLSPGTLSSILTPIQKNTITNLKLTGEMDARDFKTMRDSMLLLSDIDIGEVSIAPYTGTQGTTGSTDFTYPENTIPQKSFLSDMNLTSLILPTDITSIDDSAFYNSGLSGVLSIPNSVVSIGNSAFEKCWNLTGTLELPNSVRTIGTNVFADCQNLNGLVLSNSLTAISDGAFDGDWSLNGYLQIPNSVTSIGDYAFYYCYLTGVFIPTSVSYLGVGAFGKCKFLSGDLIIPTSITSISDGAFASCARLTSISIPTSVTSIGNFAFTMSGLTDVTIPNSVKSIGDYAFAFTKNKSFPDSIITIGVGAFYSSGLSGSITIPNSLTSLGAQAFAYDSITDFIVQNDNPFFSVSDGVLLHSNQTRLVAFPSKKQGNYTIPNSILSIEDYAFEDCLGLTDISIQNSVTTIGIGAFYECNNLNLVKIPTSVTKISDLAFFGCYGLKSVYVDSTIPVDLSSSVGVFGNTSNTTTCTLYVPVGSKTLYQSADQWKDFVNIVEMTSTGVNRPAGNQDVKIYPTVVTDGFYIDAGDKAPQVFLFSLNGIQLFSKQVTGKSYIDISTLQQGVYLVKIATPKSAFEKKLVKK